MSRQSTHDAGGPGRGLQDPPQDPLREEDYVLLGRDQSSVPAHDETDCDTDVENDTRRSQMPAFWQGFVGNDEAVLWTGRRDPAVAAGRKRAASPLALIGMGAMAVVGVILLADPGEHFPVKLFGLILCIAAITLFLRNRPGQRGQELHYLLSDRAIYVACVTRGNLPDVTRHAVTPKMQVTSTDSSVRLTIGSRKRRDEAAQPIFLDIEDIPDAANLRALVRSLQKRMA